MRLRGLLLLFVAGMSWAAVCEPDATVKAALKEQQAARADRAKRAGAIERFDKLAAEHPGDATYAYLQARALIDTDTPRAIEILQKIAPDFDLARIPLADVYSSGKFMDRARERAELNAFADACPGSMNLQFLSLARRTVNAELAAKITLPLRERLEKAPVEEALSLWVPLWTLEFQARPIPEHPAERERIVKDLQRIEQQAGKPTAALLAMEVEGYKAAGDETASKRYSDRLEAEFPQSREAANARRMAAIAEDNKWYQERRLLPGADADARRKYFREGLDYWEKRVAANPDNAQVLAGWFSALGSVEGTTNEQLLAAADRLLAAARRPGEQHFGHPLQLEVAQSLVFRGLRLDSIAALVDESMKAYEDAPSATSDRFESGSGNSLGSMVKTQAARIMIELATRQEKPEIARTFVDALKDLKSNRPFENANIWQLRGKFAELDRRKLDALMFYREAASVGFGTAYQRDVDRLWKDLGGTSESKGLIARAAATPAASKPASISTSTEWQKATKDLPAFSLTDIGGKTWKLASLEGKTVLINLWATWCGPCREEHPQLQKLYDKVKDRADLQVITLNVDEEVGKVEPYMKEHHFTFPVLMAKSYVDDVVPSLSIPQNWVVDAHGKWMWQQVGFGQPEKWEAEMMKRLEEK